MLGAVRSDDYSLQVVGNSYKYLGFGTPCSDKIIRVPSDFFNTQLAKAGTWTQIEDIDDYRALIRDAETLSCGKIWQLPGGSSSNVAKVFGRFSYSAAYFCKLGDQTENESYIQTMTSQQVQLLRQPSFQMISQVAAFINDSTGERIFRVYPTLSHDLSPSILREELFEGVKIAQFEGFMIKEYPYEFVKKAMKMAQERGASVVLDLGCESLASNYDEKFFDLLEEVDILFANEEEARILSQMKSYKDAGTILSCHLSKDSPFIELTTGNRIVVIKQGGLGASAFIADEEFSSPAFPINKIEDTDGAGDFFAGAFLYAYSKGCSISACLQAGNRVGGAVVSEIGAEIPESKWPSIIDDVEQIIQEDLGASITNAASYVEMAKTARKASLLQLLHK